MTFDVYAGAEDISEAEGERLRALVTGEDLAPTGTGAPDRTSEPPHRPTPGGEDSAL